MKKRGCEDEKMICRDVRKRIFEDMKMQRCEDVKMICANAGEEDVKARR